MKIRKAKKEDAQEITKLRRDNLGKIDSNKYLKKVVDFLIKRDTIERNLKHIKERDFFCLVEDNVILGTIGLDKDEVTDMFIKSNFVRKGLGSKLIKFIERHAKKKGLKKIWLESAQFSKVFYEKNGFKMKKIVDKGNNKINYLMEKKLK